MPAPPAPRALEAADRPLGDGHKSASAGPSHRKGLTGGGRRIFSRSRTVIALVSVVLVAVGTILIVLPGGGGTPKPAPVWHLKTAARSLVQPENPPVLWMQTSASPTQAEIRKAATSARVVVLNAWELSARRELKQLNPKLTVLVYKDLSSTRSYSGAVVDGKDADLIPTGVGYVDANTNHPDWFAVDSSGKRIEWNGYPGHWQMTVWNPAYQEAWVDSVVAEVDRNGWDGVLADNALDTLKYYAPNTTLGAGGSESQLATGIEQLVAKAGKALNQQKHILVPNIPDGRKNLGRFANLSVYGGGLEEQFLHFGSSASEGFLGDPASGKGVTGQPDSTSDWDRQAIEAASAGLILVHTQASEADRRSFLYGYASFLTAAGGFGAFSATVPDGYSGLTLQPEQTWAVPVTSAPVRKLQSLRYRWFSTLFTAVNPSPSVTLHVNLPFAMMDGTGNSVTSVTLPPHTGTVLKRPMSELNKTLEMPITLK
jgi:hypothetical protein